MNKLSIFVLFVFLTVFLIIEYIYIINEKISVSFDSEEDGLISYEYNHYICDDFHFTLELDKDIEDDDIIGFYTDIGRLQQKYYAISNNNCLNIIVTEIVQFPTDNYNFYITLKKTPLHKDIQEVCVINRNKYLVRALFMNVDLLKLDNKERRLIVEMLEEQKLIVRMGRLCKISSYNDKFQFILGLLLISNCLPIINKEWSKQLPLIDEYFKWDKVILILDEEDYNNEKYLKNLNILNTKIDYMKENGRRLVSWNFLNQSPIAFNILVFLEKYLTGNVIIRYVKTLPLYKEDEEMFIEERNKKEILSDKITIITLAYNRVRQLNYSVTYYGDVPFVDKLIIIWNNQNPMSIPKKERWNKGGVPVFFVQTNENILSNRYLPYDIVKTECLFYVDDDLKLTELLLRRSFKIWKMNHEVIVGYYGRLSQKNKTNTYVVSKEAFYDLVLTGAALISRHYIFAYTYKMPRIIKDYADKMANCEDIAFNFMVALFSNKPNIVFTKGKDLTFCKECIHYGLHNRIGHYQERINCVNMFSEFYGMNPMIRVNYFMDAY
uniref:Glyco_transf_64 domain-containing protein n=1 Tax=Parastrongyloides trichosuri TaxID=131310 RepID=A0A0N4ZLS8_PARTI